MINGNQNLNSSLILKLLCLKDFTKKLAETKGGKEKIKLLR